VDTLADRTVLLVVVVAVVLLAGALWRVAEHRRRRHAFDAPDAGTGAGLLVTSDEERPRGLGEAGAHATFVVVGTRGCSDCARTLAVLRAGLDGEAGVAVHHVLAEQAPGIVERFRVRTAPTVLLADAGSRVVGVHPGPVDLDVAMDALRDVAAGRAPFARVAR
jgi:hypothetical protein